MRRATLVREHFLTINAGNAMSCWQTVSSAAAGKIVDHLMSRQDTLIRRFGPDGLEDVTAQYREVIEQLQQSSDWDSRGYIPTRPIQALMRQHLSS